MDVLAMMSAGEAADEQTRIAWLVCDSTAPQGIYNPRGLELGRPLHRFTEAELTDQAFARRADINAVALRRGCGSINSSLLATSGSFQRYVDQDEYELWIRK